MPLWRRDLLGVAITTGTREELLAELVRLSDRRESSYVCFVNVHMLVEAGHSAAFRDVVNGANVACPDGLPVAHGIRRLYAMPQPQVAGPDTLPLLMAAAHRERKRIFVLGSSEPVLERFFERAARECPGAVICGYECPPFRPVTREEDEALVQKINDSGADMIFVALGCPKQETWMAAHRGIVQGCMFGLGYAIPVYAGVERRAPRWMIRCGLEWFFRLISDPRRLTGRYLHTNSIYLRLMIREWLKFRIKKQFSKAHQG